MRPAKLLRSILLLSAFVLAGLLSRLSAQATISSPITIPLEKLTIASTSGPYNKLGIWAALGNGTPQLFEFDTGAAGFYAAYSPNPALSPWWGTQGVVSSATPADKGYSSGFQYTGVQAVAAVSVFASGNASSPLLTSGSGTLVGQAGLIQDTKAQPPTALWNGNLTTSQSPPIDGTFWGDFGASLESNSANTGLVNILTQFQFTNGVQGGLIIHAGPQNVMTGASVQVGVTASDMATFPIQFTIQPTAGSSFPVSGFGNYPLQLLTGTLSLNGTATSPAIGISFDTGNQTPAIFEPGTNVPPAFVGAGNQLVGDTLVDVISSGTDVYAVTAGSIEGVNRVIVAPSQSGIYSINLGLPVFEQYDVAFNYETGVLGLRPVPEPGSGALAAAALLAFAASRLRRWASRRIG